MEKIIELFEDFWQNLTRGKMYQAVIAAAEEDRDLAISIQGVFIADGVPCKIIHGESITFADTNVKVEPGKMAIISAFAGHHFRAPNAKTSIITFKRPDAES